MKYYWINIDRCVNRKIFMEKQFINMNNERIDAKIPKNINFDNIIKNENSNSSGEEYGCILSHLYAIKRGYEEGHDYFYVVEDDMHIINLNDNKILSIIKDYEIRYECKIEMLQVFTNSHPLILEMYNEDFIKNNELIRNRDRDYPGTGCYLISRDGAKKILDKFVISFEDEKFDLSYSSWCCADNILYKQADTYILTYPVMVSNIEYGSEIHNSHIMNHKKANDIIVLIHSRNNQLDRFI